MRQAHRHSGLTLLEAMVVMVVLSVVAVGVAVGLQSLVRVPVANDRVLAISTELNSEVENWRAVSWGVSPWPSTLPYNATDTVNITIGGRAMTYNRTVSIQTWDPNNPTSNLSPQSDFARVQITIDAQTATFFLSKPI